MKLDITNTFSEKIDEFGITKEEFAATMSHLQQLKVTNAGERQALGFFRLLQDEQALEDLYKKAAAIDIKLTNIVIVGIGGSDLGTRAIYRALSHRYSSLLAEPPKRKLFFIGDTTDPTPLMELLDVIKPSETLFIIVSKSGETIEPAVTFQIIKAKLAEEDVKPQNHIIIVTDAKESPLKQEANKEGYDMLPIPENIGGRYSVLTSVGIFPLVLGGVDVENLVGGAKDAYEQFEASQSDIAMEYAAIQYLFMKKKYSMSVFMPYVYSLRSFGSWLRQLWAESLGKSKKLDGSPVDVTITTPVTAVGPTDQHSQLQLYNEGPNDKIFTFIFAEKFARDIEIPGKKEDVYFAEKTMSQVLKTELDVTRYVLAQNNKPNCTITIDSVSEYSLGELIVFFELSIIYLGYLLNINVFDQPGVELSKKMIDSLLGRKGFEEYSKDVNSE